MLSFKLKELKTITYLISNLKSYKKILDKYVDNTIDTIKIYSAKQIPKQTMIDKFEIHNDIISKRKKLILPKINNFDQSIKHDVIILLTNVRTDSPMLNAYFFKNNEKYTFISFSTFSSNTLKKEIPLSHFTLNSLFKGHFDISNATIITSNLNTLCQTNTKNIINLVPRYFFNLSLPLKYDSSLNLLNFYLFLKTIKNFSQIFLTISPNTTETKINIKKNNFDKFKIKKITQKYLERIFLLYSLMTPAKQNSLIQLKNSFIITDAIPLLFQTFKTI